MVLLHNLATELLRGKNLRRAGQLGIMLLLAFVAATANTQLLAANVTQMFGHALKLYQLGNYGQAMKQLTALVKRYPGHEPSHLLLGRISYRQGNMNRAAWHFKKISPDLLSDESAYEYGLTFFARGQCKSAEAGLKRVGSSFRGASLAAFYRGICFSRNRQWFLAEQQLEKAQNLPPHLVSHRRRVLDQVRQAQRQESSSRRASAAAQAISPPPVVYSPPPSEYALSEKEAAAAKESKSKPKADIPKASFQPSFGPNLSFNIASVDNDFNGNSSQHQDITTIKLGANVNLKQTFAPVKSGGQPYGSLGLSFSQDSSDISGKKSVTQAYSDSVDQTFETVTTEPKSSSHILKVSAAPEVGYPLLKTTDITAGGKMEYLKPQEATIASATGFGGLGSVTFSLGTLSLKGAGEYFQYTVTDNSSQTNKGFIKMKGSGAPTYNWPNGFYLELNGSYTTYAQAVIPPPGALGIGDINGTNYHGEVLQLGGNAGKKFEQAKIKVGASNTSYTPTSATHFMGGASEVLNFEGALEFNFELGSAIKLSGSNQSLGNFQQMVDKPADPAATTLRYPGALFQDAPAPEKTVAKASGSQTTFKVEVKVSPLDGLSGTVSLANTTTNLEAEDSKLSENLLKSNLSSSTTTSLEVGYNKSF